MADWRRDTLAAASALGTLACLDQSRGIAWFDSGEELRRSAGAGDVPHQVFGAIPVTCAEQRAALQLEKVAPLQQSPFWPSMADTAWVPMAEPLYWECSPRAFALITRAEPADGRLVKLLSFTARAIAGLAPETPASVDEVQAMMSMRTSDVRAARPATLTRVGRRTRWSRVGPWLDAIGLGRRAAARPPRRPRRPVSPLRPLGGPLAASSGEEDE